MCSYISILASNVKTSIWLFVYQFSILVVRPPLTRIIYRAWFHSSIVIKAVIWLSIHQSPTINEISSISKIVHLVFHIFTRISSNVSWSWRACYIQTISCFLIPDLIYILRNSEFTSTLNVSQIPFLSWILGSKVASLRLYISSSIPSWLNAEVKGFIP